MDKIISFIGMGKKAGFISIGETGAEIDIKKRKSSLVIVAEDASENTVKKFRNMADYRKTAFLQYGTKEELGNILGKKAVSVISVSDRKFSEALLKKVEQQRG